MCGSRGSVSIVQPWRAGARDTANDLQQEGTMFRTGASARAWAGLGAAAAAMMAGASPALAAGPSATVSFTTPGHHAFVVPAGVTSLDVTAV